MRAAQPSITAGRRGIAYRFNRGFTLVEVMVATLLLGVVGTAIVGFLSALASGGEARQQISDPAVESTLAVRRLQVLAPEFRAVLAVEKDSALIWTSDRIASRSVHLSEVARVRYDPESAELVLESVDPAAIADDRSLEREYLHGHYDEILAAFDEFRADGLMLREILSEGLESVEFSEVPGSTGIAEIDFIGEDSRARMRLAPDSLEEPLR